ncbi:cation transporter [Geomesophilobacter sediminis]|uniref:Cation transporter n=1 Tax=Geomesophilobacter sediminis TaxID=2798584 RepID=A0A8J7M277_9BACT|nr:cation transporter [Geomesophilobacter sediminis]MBJ6727228.1 cation transporter [Geomesophilobacter sediminis]
MFCDKMLRLQQLYRFASILALITIFYNLGEGVVSIWLGAEDETISLFGFGLDSFVEVISGIGIWHLVRRLGKGEHPERDRFERTALRITGGAFYLLAAGMAATAVIAVIEKHRPVTTFWGIVVSLVSICSMWLLIHYKVQVGTALNSDAILADAACTRTCLQLSVALLVASVGYSLTGIGYLDAAGSAVIALLSVREGREALQKARGLACSCSCSGKCS